MIMQKQEVAMLPSNEWEQLAMSVEHRSTLEAVPTHHAEADTWWVPVVMEATVLKKKKKAKERKKRHHALFNVTRSIYH